MTIDSTRSGMMTNCGETISDYIALDWYDGPLVEIARVDFPEPRVAGVPDAMIHVCSLCTVHELEQPPSGPLRAMVSGDEPWTRSVIRLTRSDLQKMLDLLDGKPVKGFHDE